ncbi:RNA polymerase sigma factor [Streptomyces sp. AC602_WCS936]|uniref:RNA polymerase sigma factor n=1 Tax=Streptomyces sp. AC602_WCS936 TaxID=2823685 RepID=UPI002666AC38|nr:sigma factor-like helix-turn-helix DNA-binding protein [Streptomyces sp. AC602_WCS936]
MKSGRRSRHTRRTPVPPRSAWSAARPASWWRRSASRSWAWWTSSPSSTRAHWTSWRCCGELPHEQRLVMALTIADHTPAEIAELVDRPVATVRSNLRHARSALRRIRRFDDRA